MGSSCLLSSHPGRILVQQAKRTRSDLSWGLHPLVSHRFSESKNRLFLSLEERVRLYAKALASIKLDSGRFKRRHNRKAGSGIWIHGRFRASWSTRSCRLACLPAGSQCPANTSALNQELLSPALGIQGRWVRAWAACYRPAALYLSGCPGRVRLGPGLLGEFYVIAHGAC